MAKCTIHDGLIERFYSVLYKWINVYCSGCKMPLYFRKEASSIFKLIRSNTEEFKSCSKLIYRIQLIDKNSKVLNLDDLYYSFSDDLEGIKEVIHFDRNLYNNLILIIARPLEQINLFELCCDVYESYTSRYDGEHEIISLLTKENLVEVFYLENKNDLNNYKETCKSVDLNDLFLKGKDFLKKYKIK